MANNPPRYWRVIAYLDTAKGNGLGGVKTAYFSDGGDLRAMLASRGTKLTAFPKATAKVGEYTRYAFQGPDGGFWKIFMEGSDNPQEFVKFFHEHANRIKVIDQNGNAKVQTRGSRKEGKHDPSRNEYQRKYQKGRYHERKDQAIKMLGGKCVKCDTTRNLELDHKNPDDKSFTITKLWSVPEAEFKKEVRKCRLLCHKHHLENTGKQRESGEVKSTPGKSEYGKDNKKKAAFSHRLQVVAKHLVFDDVSRIGASIAKQVAGAHDGVKALIASGFHKHDRLDQPVLTWNVFDKDEGGYQILFRVYGREKDGSVVKSVLDSVKQAMGPSGAVFEYEDDISEPGLLVKTVSGVCQ